MKTIEEVKEEIRKNVKWERAKPRTGGQSCGIEVLPVTLVSEELGFKVSVGFHRGDLKNREMMWTLFELMLDELVK